MTLRSATPADAEAIKSIMDPVIETSTSSFSSLSRSTAEWATFIEDRIAANRAFYVVEGEGHSVLGYASYEQFSPGNNGYRYTMEHSVYLTEGAQGKGLGRMLMIALIEHARSSGHHSMVAKIDASNNGSIAFHESLGFEVRGRLQEAGFKFDRWLDVVFMQKLL